MAGPLYSRFATQRRSYVYDTYSNQILSTTRAAAALLDDKLLARLRPDEIAALHPEMSANEIAEGLNDIEQAVAAGHLADCAVHRMAFYPDEQTLLRRVRSAVNHLTLELTERCNFGCRYCPQAHDDTRQARKADMSLETMRNAISCFVERTSAAGDRTISFWGGEPLVRFNIMKYAVQLTADEYPELQPIYSFTTNASLISESIAQFLAHHRVQLLVSLDGPPGAHDLYRRTRGDGPTFQRVIAGLTTLRDVDPEYFASHVRYNCVLTPGTDFAAVFGFFQQHELTRGHRVMFNPVSGTGTTFYQQYGTYTPEQQRFLRRDACDECARDSQQQYRFKRLLQIAVRPRTPLAGTIPVNGCCVPLLKKMLVTVTGDVYMCERSPYDLCLGNVNRGGIDDGRIVELVQQYVAQSLPHCRTCWAMRLCSACYRDSMRNGQWVAEARAESCERHRRGLLSRLTEYAETLEREPAALDAYKNVTLTLPV